MIGPVRCNTDFYGFSGGACEARSRQEEEGDAWPSSTTTNEEIARNLRLPNGLRARVRSQPLACADKYPRNIQLKLWAQQLSCYFGIDHLVQGQYPPSYLCRVDCVPSREVGS